jgi:hypothetical protein
MDSEALLHPRGPLPPAVYWRRRLLTLGVVVVLLALVVRSCTTGGGTHSLGQSTGPSGPVSPTGSPSRSAAPRTTAPASSASPSASRTASPTASPTPSGSPKPCAAADLVLSAKADAQTYAAGRHPVLTIGIANKGRVACTRDVGQPAREIKVTSGNDRVWSSDDCSTGGAAQVVTLQPGAAPVTFSVTWSRKRSAPGCKAGQAETPPGTYRVTGRFGDLTSTGDTFTLG